MKKVLSLGIIVGLIFSLISCNNSLKIKNSTLNDENRNRSIDEKIALNNVNDINIEIRTAEVSIKSYDGDEVKITGELSEKSEALDVNKNNSKIEVVERNNEAMELLGDKNHSSKFYILIPSKFNGSFTFKQGIGISDIEEIKVKNINITGDVGALNCKNIKFENLNLNSSVGKININLNEKCGNIELKGGAGEIDIKLTEIGGNLNYKGGVGNCNITIPKNSPVKFVTENGAGECNINAKTSEQKNYIFNLKTGVGVINVQN